MIALGIIAMLLALAAVVGAGIAARHARSAAAKASEFGGTLGRIRAELAAVRETCPACQAGKPDEHARMWAVLAGGK